MFPEAYPRARKSGSSSCGTSSTEESFGGRCIGSAHSNRCNTVSFVLHWLPWGERS